MKNVTEPKKPKHFGVDEEFYFDYNLNDIKKREKTASLKGA